jgi:hypothetical protein
MDEIGALVYFDPIDGFWDEPMKIGVSLSVRVAYHVDRNAIDENGEVAAMIRIETTKEDLIRFAAAVMLPDNQSRRQPKHVGRRARGAKLQISCPSSLLRRR